MNAYSSKYELLILFECRRYDSRGHGLEGQRHALWDAPGFHDGSGRHFSCILPEGSIV